MNNLINAVDAHLNDSQASVVLTRQRVADLKAHLISVQQSFNSFKINYLELESQHQQATNTHNQNIDPILNDLYQKKNDINLANNKIKHLRSDLEKATSCSQNCNTNFVQRVMKQINEELKRNQVDENGFNLLFTHVDDEMKNFETIDSQIIVEFNRVLTELTKLNAQGITTPPFQSIQLLINNLIQLRDALNEKKNSLNIKKNNFVTSRNESIRMRNISHDNKIKHFDNILQSVANRSRNLISIRPSLNEITNTVKSRLANLRSSQKSLAVKIKNIMPKIENILNRRMSSLFITEYMFLIFVVFFIFFINCFIRNE